MKCTKQKYANKGVCWAAIQFLRKKKLLSAYPVKPYRCHDHYHILFKPMRSQP